MTTQKCTRGCKGELVGKSSLPAQHAAYVTAEDIQKTNPVPRGVLLQNQAKGKGYVPGSEPVYQSPLPPGGCGSDSVKPTCSPFKSFKKLVKDVCFDWVSYLSPKKSSEDVRLLISDGNGLGTLRSRCDVPVRLDGDRVLTDHPDLLTHKDTEEAVIENGLLPLAMFSTQICEDDAGNLIEEDIIQHGYQQVREAGFGEMLGLRRDCVTGAVRQDVIQPEHIDLVENGWLPGLRHLGFIEEQHEVEEGGCLQTVKRWLTTDGAVFGPTEVLEDETCTSYEASLMPRALDNEDCQFQYQLAFRKIDEHLSPITEEDRDNFRLLIAQVSSDPECPEKIDGHCKEWLPIPEILVGDTYQHLLECLQKINTRLERLEEELELEIPNEDYCAECLFEILEE